MKIPLPEKKMIKCFTHFIFEIEFIYFISCAGGRAQYKIKIKFVAHLNFIYVCWWRVVVVVATRVLIRHVGFCRRRRRWHNRKWYFLCRTLLLLQSPAPNWLKCFYMPVPLHKRTFFRFYMISENAINLSGTKATNATLKHAHIKWWKLSRQKKKKNRRHNILLWPTHRKRARKWPFNS